MKKFKRKIFVPLTQLFFIASIIFFLKSSCEKNWWDKYNLNKTAITKIPVSNLLTKDSLNRNHQTIFNEIIFDIEDIDQNFCLGKTKNIWHEFDDKNKIPIREDIIFKKDIILLSDLLKEKISLNIIPPPIFDKEDKINKTEIITLVLPWEEEISKQKYSAGTRFVHLSKFDTENKFCIIYYNNNIKAPSISFIPKNLTIDFLISNSKIFKKDKRKLFIEILKIWINTANSIENKVIPYVWGGASLVDLYDNNFKPTEFPAQNLTNYKEENFPENLTGFDCSGLVLRAAQVAGINYFYRYTGLLARLLTPIKYGQKILEGDLIWIPGHVMIISDIKNNLLIEATGYKWGYGKLHQISLKNRMKNINSYKDLLKRFFKKDKLILLAKDGVETSFEEFKILRININ